MALGLSLSLFVLRHMQRYFSHICDGTDVQADWRRNCIYGRAPNAISQGSLTCPSKHRHVTTLFIRWFRHAAPFSRLLRQAGDTEDVFSTQPPPPPASSRGYGVGIPTIGTTFSIPLTSVPPSHDCNIVACDVKHHQVKSRKYQGVFEVKSRVKTWQVRWIWSQQLEH